MSFERLVKNPRKALKDTDSWVRRRVLSIVSKEPNIDDRIFLEEMLESDDPTTAFLAYKGLSRLFPLTNAMKSIWQDFFAETIDLLEKRASSGSGSAQIRTAAIKALAFSTDLSLSIIESILKSLFATFSYETSFIASEPLLPLLSKPSSFSLPESFGILLASMPIEQEGSIKIIKRELDCQNPDRLIPAMISLQLNSNSEMTDQLLWIARNGEKRVADEAVRALLACGGKKVCLFITSLLKEVRDPERRAIILSMSAATDREEIWPVLVGFARGKNKELAITALRAIDGYSNASVEDKIHLYSEIVRSKEPDLIALAALLAYKAGSIKSIRVIKQLLNSDSEKSRFEAVSILSEFPSEKAIPMLITAFDEETDENTICQIFLSLRSLLPKISKNELIENTVLPWLNRILASSDAFIRNQSAVLCGCLGPSSEEIALKALSKETHPYVIASLLAALGKCGCDKLILFSKYHDHNDPRVRANMVWALRNCGNEAIPYLNDALSDSSPRVRAGAAYNLFLLGQLYVIKTLNGMLQVPEPLSVLSSCYAIFNIFKIILPRLEADHPLALAMGKLALESQRHKKVGPGLLNSPEAPDLFSEMATCAGNQKRILWLLEEKHKRRPSSFLITRLLASLYILNNENTKALPLIEICVRENPTDLADLLDAYRTVIKLGNLNRANELGDKTKKLYKMLLDGCIELCKELRGTGAALMLQRLNFLNEPSMNLYNAMIQLKVVEDDPDTVMYLMTELILARPFNANLINKLTEMMPEEYSALKEALLVYVKSLVS